MRTDWTAVPADMTVADFRLRVPLGSTTKAVLTDGEGRYAGIVLTAAAYHPDIAGDAPIAQLATQTESVLRPVTGIEEIIAAFDAAAADELVVVDGLEHVLGVVTERHARRRYFEALDKAQKDLFGES